MAYVVIGPFLLNLTKMVLLLVSQRICGFVVPSNKSSFGTSANPQDNSYRYF